MKSLLVSIYMFLSPCIINYQTFAMSNGNASPQYQLGEIVSFFEINVNGNKLEFELIAMGQNCNIWIINSFDDISKNLAKTVTLEIDYIYYKMTSLLYEHKNSWGDINQDGKISILLCDLSSKGLNGYYSFYDIRSCDNSNQQDILYIDFSNQNGQKKLRDDNGQAFYSIIAHEFQHMLNDIICNTNIDKKDSNDLWLNEMSSLIAESTIISEAPPINEKLFNYFLHDYGSYEGIFFTDSSNVSNKNLLMINLLGLYLHNRFENILCQIYSEYHNGNKGIKTLNNILVANDICLDDFLDDFFLQCFFDGVIKSDNRIFNKPIECENELYENLYELRAKKDLLLLKTNINNNDLSTRDFQYIERLNYYTQNSLNKYAITLNVPKNQTVFLIEIINNSTFKYKKIFGLTAFDKNVDSAYILVLAKETAITGELSFNKINNIFEWENVVAISAISVSLFIILFFIKKVRSKNYEKINM